MEYLATFRKLDGAPSELPSEFSIVYVSDSRSRSERNNMDAYIAGSIELGLNIVDYYFIFLVRKAD